MCPGARLAGDCTTEDVLGVPAEPGREGGAKVGGGICRCIPAGLCGCPAVTVSVAIDLESQGGAGLGLSGCESRVESGEPPAKDATATGGPRVDLSSTEASAISVSWSAAESTALGKETFTEASEGSGVLCLACSSSDLSRSICSGRRTLDSGAGLEHADARKRLLFRAHRSSSRCRCDLKGLLEDGVGARLAASS